MKVTICEEKEEAMPVINLVKTGTNIENYMEVLGYSVADIQKLLGLAGPQAIYHWLNGMCLPRLDNLVILASIFGVKVDDLIVVEKAGDWR